MKVVAWSQNLTAERAKEAGATLVSKEELLRSADFVTVHQLLSARTRGLIGAAELALMKPTAYLHQHLARADRRREGDLSRRCAQRKIAGAAIDVFDEEPLPLDHPVPQARQYPDHAASRLCDGGKLPALLRADGRGHPRLARRQAGAGDSAEVRATRRHGSANAPHAGRGNCGLPLAPFSSPCRKKPTLRRPYCLVGAGCALFSTPSAALEKNRGRAGRTWVPNGPAGLDASRHRGLSKSGSRRRFAAPTSKAASPPVPRRPARGVYRLAPRRFPVVDAYVPCGDLLPLRTRHSGRHLLTRRRPYRPSGPSTRTPSGPEASRLGPPGRVSASPPPRHSPATAPRPVSEDAVQTPLGNEAGWRALSGQFSDRG